MRWLQKGILVVWILLCCVLDVYLIRTGQPAFILYLVVGIELLAGIVVGMTYYQAKSEMTQLVIQLSQLIEQLVSLDGQEVFEPLEESITSKLQVQITRLTTILRAQTQRSDQARRELEGLVADIAHQLKTPLTNIGLYTQLLESKTCDEAAYKTFYNGLYTEVEKLQFLLEELIKMSRLESGVIKIQPQEASIQETCLRAIKGVYLKAKQKDIRLRFEGGKELCINHDAKWTTEALMNLLDNAIKYSASQTEVCLQVTAYEMFVRIDIIDQGIGIEEAEYAQIFKRFYRGYESKAVEGIGIGLYLVRKILEAQGGVIKVKSQKEHGTVFSVMLPIQKLS